MTWADLDLNEKDGRWSIPATSRKGGKAHVVPLSTTVVSILQNLAAEAERRGPVFRGARGKSIAHNPSRFTAAIRAACPGVTNWKLHDLRRTCATGCARLGSSRDVVRRVLGHENYGVAAVYDRFDQLPAVASALSAWQAHVVRVVKDEKTTADVLPFVGGSR